MPKPHWSPEEIELLRKYYATEDIQFLRKLFPKRSYEAILHRASRLRLKKARVRLMARTLPDLTVEQRAYLAGLIDGEGTITIGFRRGGLLSHYMPTMTPLVAISNSSLALIDYCRSLLKCSTVKRNEQTDTRRLVWTLQIARLLDVEAFLEQVLPYLVAKKKQAELVLGYCKIRKRGNLLTYDDKLFEIAEKVRELNKKGPQSPLSKTAISAYLVRLRPFL